MRKIMALASVAEVSCKMLHHWHEISDNAINGNHAGRGWEGKCTARTHTGHAPVGFSCTSGATRNETQLLPGWYSLTQCSVIRWLRFCFVTLVPYNGHLCLSAPRAHWSHLEDLAYISQVKERWAFLCTETK